MTGKAAFYDVDGTLVRTNIVHAYGYYATNRGTVSGIAGRTLATLASAPLFAALDLVDRKAFNELFYRSYAGLSEDRLLTLAYVEMPMRDRVELVTNEVMAALYDWPVRLPSEMVYFARTAALIEGLGVRYDGSFNAITFASPIASFYLTNPIARASVTMAECQALAAGPAKLAAE